MNSHIHIVMEHSGAKVCNKVIRSETKSNVEIIKYYDFEMVICETTGTIRNTVRVSPEKIRNGERFVSQYFCETNAQETNCVVVLR